MLYGLSLLAIIVLLTLGAEEMTKHATASWMIAVALVIGLGMLIGG